MPDGERSTVRYETRDRVAVITLDRPEARNAIDPATSRGVSAAVDRAEADPTVRVVVLTGAGEVFCAGADLKVVADGRLSEITDLPGGFCGLVARTRRKPMIAAVNGHALAGGLELALACDVIVAVEDARLGLPEVSRGIIAGAGGLFRLASCLPPKRAMEMILTAEPMGVGEAAHLGLVGHVVARGEALGRALEIAARIAENAPVAVRESRAIVEAASEPAAAAMWERIARAWTAVIESPDLEEGARAFAERRAPRWAD